MDECRVGGVGNNIPGSREACEELPLWSTPRQIALIAALRIGCSEEKTENTLQ